MYQIVDMGPGRHETRECDENRPSLMVFFIVAVFDSVIEAKQFVVWESRFSFTCLIVPMFFCIWDMNANISKPRLWQPGWYHPQVRP